MSSVALSLTASTCTTVEEDLSFLLKTTSVGEQDASTSASVLEEDSSVSSGSALESAASQSR